MSDDALERLKKRQRPSVTARDASLSNSSQGISTSNTQDISNSSSQDTSTSGYQDTLVSKNQTGSDSSSQDTSTSRYQDTKASDSQTSSDSSNQDIFNSKSQDISTSRYQDAKVSTPPELKTKQSTIRLEAELSERLSEVCKANGISREVLIEALFEHYSADPQVWQAILALAKAKGEQRMQVANMKRAQSMMQRFNYE
ncbi:MAG: ribbon-helix-helix protein, CopG family [Nostoc sp. DedQUE01]